MSDTSRFAAFAEFTPRSDTVRFGAADGLVIRDGAERDLAALARISGEREGRSEGESRRSFERLLAECEAGAGARLLVAELRGLVAGFGKAARFEPPLHAPSNIAPAGWYLSGLVVDPAFRRRGIGDALTGARLDWIAGRSPAAYYFANAQNEVTIALHRRHGFVELTRSFHFPGANFRGGVGILFRADLAGRAPLGG